MVSPSLTTVCCAAIIWENACSRVPRSAYAELVLVSDPDRVIEQKKTEDKKEDKKQELAPLAFSELLRSVQSLLLFFARDCSGLIANSYATTTDKVLMGGEIPR